MYKNFSKTIVLFMLSLSFMPFAFAQKNEAVTYSSDKVYFKTIEDKAKALLKDENFKPLLEIATEAKSLKNNMPVTEEINLPKVKAAKNKMEGEELFNKCKTGVLTMNNIYNCGNCDKTHAATYATAFAITTDGVCVTNYHVLERFIENKTDEIKKDSIHYVGTIDGKIYTLEKILAYSKDGDLAIFKIATNGDKLNPIPLGDPAGIAATAHAITHPQRNYYYYSKGVVARNIIMDDNKTNSERMEITTDYATGSSGGPILNDYGQVIGMVSTTHTLFAGKEHTQMVIKSTTPVITMKKLLKLK